MDEGRVSGRRAPKRDHERRRWAKLFFPTHLRTAAIAAAGGAFLLAHGGLSWAQKNSPCRSVKEQVSALKVTLYKSRTLCFSGPFSTAIIGAPEIADVLPMTDSMLYVQGKKVGSTNISVFDPQKRLVSVIDLEVAPDTI